MSVVPTQRLFAAIRPVFVPSLPRPAIVPKLERIRNSAGALHHRFKKIGRMLYGAGLTVH
jgi:hypothetical protein